MITFIIVLVILLAAVAKGYQQGFIKGFGSLISAIISASAFVYIFRWWQSDSFFKIILVLLLVLVFWGLFKLFYWILSKILKILYVIPFMKGIDKILGGILGILEGVLAVTVLNYIIGATTWLNFLPWENGALLTAVVNAGKLLIIGI